MSGKIKATIIGFVRQLNRNDKIIRFAIPVYAGGKDDNAMTKWFEIAVFDVESYSWLKEGQQVVVENPILSLSKGHTKTFESWNVGYYGGTIKKIADPVDEEDSTKEIVPF